MKLFKPIFLLESKINVIMNFLEKKFSLTLLVLFFISLVIRLAVTPFDMILNADAYNYLLKSLEIVQSNFIPVLDRPDGWSFVMAPFFYLFKSASIFQNMAYTRIISNIFGALAIFPLAYLGKKLLNKRSLFVLLILFTFSSRLIRHSTTGLTESLFIFLLITTVFFIVKTTENKNYILVAALFGALAYYVRTNGLLFLFVILFSLFILRKQIPKFNYKSVIYIILVFFLVSSPFLYQRHIYFGSPFTYGPVSNYFADDYQKVWSPNLPSVSLTDYLSTHTFNDYIQRFVVNGFFKVIYNFIGAISSQFLFLIPLLKNHISYAVIYLFAALISLTLAILLLLTFLEGLKSCFKNKKFIPLTVVFIFWIITLSIIYNTHYASRYLDVIIPLILIFNSAGIIIILRNNRYKNLILALFLIGFIIFSLITPIGFLYLNQEEKNAAQDGLGWGKWASENIKGKIAIVGSGELIMMHLPDTMIAGVSQPDLYAPISNLSITTPCYFENLSAAMEWFQKTNITHLAIDEYSTDKRPYFKETIYKNRKYIQEIYSNYNTSSKWKMRIYYLNYSAYEQFKKLHSESIK